MSEQINIDKALETYGLMPKEIKVYLAGMELGTATAQEIARKTGIERTNVYSLLEGLMHKGIFAETLKSGKKHFTAEYPEKLVLKLKERQRLIEQAMPELKSLYNLSPKKPSVRYYEGVEGIKEVYEDTLKEGEPIVAFSDFEQMLKTMPANYMTHYAERRAKARISFKAILRPSKRYDELQSKNKEYRREVRLLPNASFTTEINIYGDKVALINFRKNLFAVIIEGPEIANTMRIIFNSLWRSLET